MNVNSSPESLRLTEYSHGAGCGCKISPEVLDTMLKGSDAYVQNSPNLVVGNHSRDDAAVYDLGDGTGVISTTDFFMPIVDDGFEFGRIAAANALSDVYAMGGQPLMAIAILGWPLDKLDPKHAQPVLRGGKAMCAEAGIPLAGGHSIDCPEPIFGLAVTGRVSLAHLKRNDGARANDLLYLTKPLGVGILATAQKQQKLQTEHQSLAPSFMTRLNRIGAEFGKLDFVHAMTDVTGFGLLGHLLEMGNGSGLGAHISFDQVPAIPEAIDYLRKGCVPGGTRRNWKSYGDQVHALPDAQRNLLADPQTSGGLLVAVDPAHREAFEAITLERGIELKPFGRMVEGKGVEVD